MKMHAFFSFSRFVRLLACDLQLNFKRYLLTVVGGLILLFVITAMNTSYHINYQSIFWITLLLLGVIIGCSFPEMSDKKTTANYLMLPASNFEKYLSQIVIYILGGTFIFMLLFYIDVHLMRWILQTRHQVHVNIFEWKNILSMGGYKFTWMIWVIIISVGCYLFAVRLFFRRYAVVKTAFSLVILILLALCSIAVWLRLFYPCPNCDFIGDLNIPHRIVFRCHIGEGIYSFDNEDVLTLVIFNVSWIVFLVLGYFKLKEKQS